MPFAEVSYILFLHPPPPKKKTTEQYYASEKLQLWQSVKTSPIKQVSPKLMADCKKKGRVSSKLNIQSHYLIFKNKLKQEGHFCGYAEHSPKILMFLKSLLTASSCLWEKSSYVFWILYCWLSIRFVFVFFFFKSISQIIWKGVFKQIIKSLKCWIKYLCTDETPNPVFSFHWQYVEVLPFVSTFSQWKEWKI